MASNYYDPFSMGTDDTDSGFTKYPSPDAETLKEEEEEKTASWTPTLKDVVNTPGLYGAFSSAKNTAEEAVRRAVRGDKNYLGWTLPQQAGDAVTQYIRLHKDDLELKSGVSAQSVNSSGALAPSTVDYLYSDLAKHYGMDASTAYQEALSNTAYQRAVADMKRAGLNPASIFGAGRGQTAGGVGYVGSGNSASGYASDEDDYGLSKSSYSFLTGLLGVASVALLKGIHNPYVRFLIGTSAAKGLAGLIGMSQGK